MDQPMRQDVDFDKWWHFDDRPSDERDAGPARTAEIKGRCANCWGPVAGRKDGDDRWIHIQCRLCGQSVDGEAAEREAKLIQLEAKRNMPRARVGGGSKYREDARFVLKILPDMDRDTAWFDQRVAASLEAKPKGLWLDRRNYSRGTAGYLYLQACAFLSGLESLPREMPAIALSDFDFGETRIVGVDTAAVDAVVRVSGVVPRRHPNPSNPALVARMGTTLVGGMVASFACEVGMKALLMTRQDKAEKTHDLLKLYQALPPDSRKRLEADFAGIAKVLEDNRHAFGKWRYFEDSESGDTIAALVNTDRVWELGKAARVIVDECVVAGLQYEVKVEVKGEIDVTADRGDMSYSGQIGVSVTGEEAAIPWDRVLPAGRGR